MPDISVFSGSAAVRLIVFRELDAGVPDFPVEAFRVWSIGFFHSSIVARGRAGIKPGCIFFNGR